MELYILQNLVFILQYMQFKLRLLKKIEIGVDKSCPFSCGRREEGATTEPVPLDLLRVVVQQRRLRPSRQSLRYRTLG